MPLDCKKLPRRLIETLKSIPIDTYVKSEESYQTKVKIYDTNCKGCGFSLAVIRSITNPSKIIKKFENDLDKAIDYVTSERDKCVIERTCSYPNDLIETDDGVIYPSLNEIIVNSCKFWNAKNIEGNDEEEI